MKVLMIAPQPFFQPRGTPFSVLHRLKALSKLGYHIDLVTYPIGQDVAIDNVRIFRAARVPFIKNIAIGPSVPKVFLDATLYRKAIALLRQNRYDLLHTHEEAGFMGIRLAKKFRLLHLYDMHSSLPQQLSNFKYSTSKTLVRTFEALEKKCIDSADAVITICPELRDYVDQRFPGKYNKLIENVADNSIVFEREPAVDELRRQFNVNGETIILYTGTFEPYQGLDLLIDASPAVVRAQQDVKFLVVGGKPGQVDQYKRKTESNGTAGNYIFTGQRPPEEIPVFMKMAQVLVSPRIEGNNTPLKIYSYLRSGIPIVATNHITHTQVLNAEVAVLTETQPQAFAGGIISVLHDRDYARKLTENARRLAEREYSYEAYLQKTRDIYGFLAERLSHKNGH